MVQTILYLIPFQAHFVQMKDFLNWIEIRTLRCSVKQIHTCSFYHVSNRIKHMSRSIIHNNNGSWFTVIILSKTRKKWKFDPLLKIFTSYCPRCSFFTTFVSVVIVTWFMHKAVNIGSSNHGVSYFFLKPSTKKHSTTISSAPTFPPSGCTSVFMSFIYKDETFNTVSIPNENIQGIL